MTSTEIALDPEGRVQHVPGHILQRLLKLRNRSLQRADGPLSENPFGCDPDPDQVAIFLDTVFSWCEGLMGGYF